MILVNQTEEHTNGDTNINDIYKETFQFSGLNQRKEMDESNKCHNKNKFEILEVCSNKMLAHRAKENLVNREKNSLNDFNISAAQIENIKDKLQCRICLEEGDCLYEGPNQRALPLIKDNNFISNSRLLISPCDCKGSLTYVHYVCLIKWINESYAIHNYNDATCELCLKPFVFYESHELKPFNKEMKYQITKVLLSGIAVIVVINIIIAFVIVNFSNMNLFMYIMLSTNSFLVTFLICYMKRFISSLPRESVQDFVVLDKHDPRYSSAA